VRLSACLKLKESRPRPCEPNAERQWPNVAVQFENPQLEQFFFEPFASACVDRLMPPTNDEELVTLLKKDPEKGFSAIYGRYASTLDRLICRFTSDQQSAEEILHDVFMELWKNEFSETSADGLKNWLFTLAKNKSLNHFRRSKKQEPFADLQASTDSPLSRLEHKEFARHFQKAQDKMPKEFKDVWSLRQTGMEHRRIAEELGIPLGTVKSRFHRMIEFLKESLQNEIN
jgi:RNA polymerase sigma factor (sigma-70 family)